MTWDQCQFISFSKNYNSTNYGKKVCRMITPSAYQYQVVMWHFISVLTNLFWLGTDTGWWTAKPSVHQSVASLRFLEIERFYFQFMESPKCWFTWAKWCAWSCMSPHTSSTDCHSQDGSCLWHISCQPTDVSSRALRYGFFHCRFDMIFWNKLKRFRYDIDNLAHPLYDLDSIPIFLKTL